MGTPISESARGRWPGLRAGRIPGLARIVAKGTCRVGDRRSGLFAESSWQGQAVGDDAGIFHDFAQAGRAETLHAPVRKSHVAHVGMEVPRPARRLVGGEFKHPSQDRRAVGEIAVTREQHLRRSRDRIHSHEIAEVLVCGEWHRRARNRTCRCVEGAGPDPRPIRFARADQDVWRIQFV